HQIDIGPGAGPEGGRIVFQGVPRESRAVADGTRSVPATRSVPRGWLQLEGARRNNLQNITVAFPLGVLCVVTGVSGSGKSSLVQETLYPALSTEASGTLHADYDSITGVEQVDDVILVDQSPIARSSRSNPATCLKVFDEIRALFAGTAEAKV